MTLKKVGLICIFVSLIYPLWILFAYSFSGEMKLLMFPIRLFPKNPVFTNYRYILGDPSIGIWALNTLLLVLTTALFSTLVSMMTGYVFALYEFRFKKILWAAFLFGVMVPRISIIIPLFIITSKLKISGTLLACLLPSILNPVGIYLARNYFSTIPKRIIEAARIDGAGDLRILCHIGIPLCGPIVSALSLFSAIGAMGDWIWQALQLQDTNVQTLLVGLMRIALRRGAQIYNTMGRQMAVGIVLLFPMLVLFIVANKYFTGGLSSAIKE